LVRTELAGICGTDVHLWKGELPIALPVILGHETAGRIEQLGAGVDTDWAGNPLRIGDRVTWTSTTSCGDCYYCVKKRQPTRCHQRRAYGIGYRCDEPPHLLGGYAEFHYLRPRANIFRIPESLPNEAVIGAGCALITAIHGVERICREPPGVHTPSSGMPVLPALWKECVVVQGAGPVGISAIAVARNAGAERVIVVGGPKNRLELARRFGADESINIEEFKEPGARIDAIRQRTGGHGADVVLECVGIPAAVVEGMELCRDGGKYLVLGQYCDAGPVSLHPHVITRKQLEVHGSWSSEPRHMQAALNLLQQNSDRFPFASLVTRRFNLTQATEALSATANWQTAKSVIVPG
jgi:threonine dehydrogenase-like Zn-dependent dehydrogenase